jgi:hypothetical protein
MVAKKQKPYLVESRDNIVVRLDDGSEYTFSIRVPTLKDLQVFDGLSETKETDTLAFIMKQLQLKDEDGDDVDVSGLSIGYLKALNTGLNQIIQLRVDDAEKK